MKNEDSIIHTQGISKFLDDLTLPQEVLEGVIFTSPVAKAKIKSLNINKAKNLEGVYEIFTAKNIPKKNQIGVIIEDEPLLAKDEISYIGQPIAFVVALNKQKAIEALEMIELLYEELPAIFDTKDAYKKNELILPPTTICLGDIDNAWEKCNFIIEGEVNLGGQEHLYFETQSALAYPTEMGGLKILASTQSPKDIQNTISKVLGISMHKIEVDILRIGGGFGGKEVQAIPWATLVALGAFKLKKPVRLILNRDEDIRITGKRHPYSSNYKIGFTKEAKILAFEVNYYQNAGAFADASPAVLSRTLMHTSNSYFIPNIKATGFSCRTNLPPNTAFRGYGAPQAFFVIESAIYKASKVIDIEVSTIQEKNLLKNGNLFPYEMKLQNSQLMRCWREAYNIYSVNNIRQEINEFNQNHQFEKKGFALTPICYGVSFHSAIFLCQATALVHIYSDDGSISLSTGGVEMGQGINMKLRILVSKIFSINIDRIKVESVNTTRIANASPTAASLSSDLQGNATKLACNILLDRLKKFIASTEDIKDLNQIIIKDEKVFINNKETKISWEDLISNAYFERISLSSQAHYKIPKIHFDQKSYKGRPFSYHVFGVAITEVTLDCIRGTYKVDSVKVVHDAGKSLSHLIDKGQTEGGIVQGLGWMLLEELKYDKKGNLLTDTLSTYKIPDINFAPQIYINFLENSTNEMGIFNSKAIGEPPFMYGIGGYFALLEAMREFNPNIELNLHSPLTHEKVLLALYNEKGR